MTNPAFQLTDKQLDRLSEFTANTGLIPLASAVGQLFLNISGINIFMLLLGVGTSFLCVFASLLLLKEGK